jgi:hypothetical protein
MVYINLEFTKYSASFFPDSTFTSSSEWSPVIILFPSNEKSILKLLTCCKRTTVFGFSLGVECEWVGAVHLQGVVDVGDGEFC